MENYVTFEYREKKYFFDFGSDADVTFEEGMEINANNLDRLVRVAKTKMFCLEDGQITPARWIFGMGSLGSDLISNALIDAQERYTTAIQMTKAPDECYRQFNGEEIVGIPYEGEFYFFDYGTEATLSFDDRVNLKSKNDVTVFQTARKFFYKISKDDEGNEIKEKATFTTPIGRHTSFKVVFEAMLDATHRFVYKNDVPKARKGK
jgi:hypothetical protein